MFATKKTRELITSAGDVDGEEKKKKTELKVLDGKTAQNLCKLFDP